MESLVVEICAFAHMLVESPLPVQKSISNLEQKHKARVSYDGWKADTWALGMTFMEMFFGIPMWFTTSTFIPS